jgi:phytoene dehydrogenase-like protein
VSEKSVIVIGGGISGLCTGVYAAANGYDTTVLEANSEPGGLCTSWTRSGYTFDSCIHYLVGTKPDSHYFPFWAEVGALDGLETRTHTEFGRFRTDDERELVIHADIDRTQDALLAFAPADKKPIAELCDLVRHASKAMPPTPPEPPQLMKARDGLHMATDRWSSMGVTRKTAGTTLEDYSRHFSDPALRRIVSSLLVEDKVSLMALVYTLAAYNTGDAVWVMGGSQAFARRIEGRLAEFGGRIAYDSKAVQILVEDGRATGVRLEDGSEHRADHVISAADPHETLFELLGVQHVDARWRSLFAELPTFHPLVQVSLGVRSDFSDEPHFFQRVFDEPRDLAGLPWPNASVTNYAFDPSLAPDGCSAVTVLLHGDLERWRALRDRSEDEYVAEKDAVAQRAIDVAQECLPVAHSAVEVADVATPLTFVRYSHAWKASYQGWLPTPETARKVSPERFDATVPGVAGLRLAGQWLSPGGGLPAGVLTARWAVSWLCHDDGRDFRSPAV